MTDRAQAEGGETAVEPKRGEVRVIDGNWCRFIERELEGDKWEVIAPVNVADLAQRCRSQASLIRAMDAIANAGGTIQTQEPTAKLLDAAAETILSAPQTPTAGEGWRLVPAKATPEMTQHGCSALKTSFDQGGDNWHQSMAKAYAAMLAAAPSPTAGPSKKTD